jgi:hypothetical protein
MFRAVQTVLSCAERFEPFSLMQNGAERSIHVCETPLTLLSFVLRLSLLLHYSDDTAGGIIAKVKSSNMLSEFGDCLVRLGKGVNSQFERSSQAGAAEVCETHSRHKCSVRAAVAQHACCVFIKHCVSALTPLLQ